MIDQNRRMPPAPSTAAASCRSRGIDCSPAVTMMNVNPRLAHTLDRATANSAVSGSCSQPGSFTIGKMLLNHADVGERTDRRLEQEEPHQAGHGDRGGDRRREDGPEGADPAQVLVGEHRQADAEDDRRAAT